jgi:hypothetical protein
MHVEALLEAVLVRAAVVFVVGRWLVLGRPPAAALAVVVVAPLAQVGVVIVLKLDAEVEVARTLCRLPGVETAPL